MSSEHSGTPLPEESLQQLFTEARTYTSWLPKPVSDDSLRELYDLLKFGPTSANSCPARFVFVRTPEGKERLKPALMPLNLDKTMTAPVTAIAAFDEKFYQRMPELFPLNPAMGENLAKMPNIGEFIMRNASLQGAYLIIAARALGLDCGPMSGFDNAKVDAAFFGGTSVKSNLLCNRGDILLAAP